DLDEREVSAFEHELADFLRSASARAQDERAPTLAGKLNDYRRHFVGVIIEGKRLIWGNFFCASEEPTATAAIAVDDGEECYFYVLYDPASRSFSELSINDGA